MGLVFCMMFFSGLVLFYSIVVEALCGEFLAGFCLKSFEVFMNYITVASVVVSLEEIKLPDSGIGDVLRAPMLIISCKVF